MRLIIISLTLLTTTFTGLSPLRAEPLKEGDRSELCSQSPQNSQCKDYQAPIALDDRSGEAGACVMTSNSTENRTVCKLLIRDGKIMAYYETGDPLQVLSGKKASREIQLSPSAIKAIRYQEGTKDNSTGRVINTFLFGLPGLFGTRNKKVAEIAIDYTMPPLSDSVSGAPSSSPEAAPKSEALGSSSGTAETKADTGTKTLKIMVRRKTGESLRRQLEQLTGLGTEAFPLK